MQFKFLGGHPALDFINTVGGRTHTSANRYTVDRERLENPEDLDTFWSAAAAAAAFEKRRPQPPQRTRGPRTSHRAARGPLSHLQSRRRKPSSRDQGRSPAESRTAGTETHVRRPNRVLHRGRSARYDRPLRRRVAHIPRDLPRPCLRRRELRLALSRHQPQPLPAMVRHGRLRQRGQSAPFPRPPTRIRMRSVRFVRIDGRARVADRGRRHVRRPQLR